MEPAGFTPLGHLMTNEVNTETTDEMDNSRRTLMKGLAIAGVLGSGIVGASGSATAQGGSYRNRLRFTGPADPDEFGGTQDVWTFDDGSTFDGRLDITGLEIVEENGELALLATGRLQGTLEENPTEQINETFEVVLGLLDQVIGLLRNLQEELFDDGDGEVPDQEECPILFLDVGPIFLDVLGLQVDISQIVIDITAVAGEGNLLGNLLCAVAGLLD